MNSLPFDYCVPLFHPCFIMGKFGLMAQNGWVKIAIGLPISLSSEDHLQPMTVSPQHLPESQCTVKLLLLGESSVGKTSLVNRCTGHPFEPSGALLTIGVEVKKIIRQSQGQRVRLQLWDTAGQEKYRTLPSQYFRGVQGILLVYDITCGESFARVEDWLAKVEQNCVLQRLVLALVGNKIDLQHLREVRRQEAANFAAQRQMRFQETSAKTAANVDSTIADMITDILEKGLAESKEKKGVSLGEEAGRSHSDSCCN